MIVPLEGAGTPGPCLLGMVPRGLSLWALRVRLSPAADEDGRERPCRYAEVPSQHLARRVRHPVGQQERVELVEVPGVEDQQELAAVLEALDRVRDPGREE